MIPFFKRSSEKKQKETAVSPQDLLEEIAATTDELVTTKLYFYGGKPEKIEDQYYFQFLLNELEPLKRNQLSIYPIELKIDKNKVYAQFFLRQSLDRNITLGNTPLLLFGDNNKLLGRIEVDFNKLGEIPAESAMPWIVEFSEADLFVPLEEITAEIWTLAFEQRIPHRLDLDITWESALAKGGKEELERVVEKLTPPKKNEVKFIGLQARVQPDGSLATTVLIRSGLEKDIELEQVPIEILDASREVVAKGAFQLPPLIIKANTSKPWTFLFPKDTVLKEQPDFSNWVVKVIQE